MRSWGVFFFYSDSFYCRLWWQGNKWCDASDASAYPHAEFKSDVFWGKKLHGVFFVWWLTAQSLAWRQICICRFLGDLMDQRQLIPHPPSSPISFKGCREVVLFFSFWFRLYFISLMFWLRCSIKPTFYVSGFSSETCCFFCTEYLSISPSNCRAVKRRLLRAWLLLRCFSL